MLGIVPIRLKSNLLEIGDFRDILSIFPLASDDYSQTSPPELFWWTRLTLWERLKREGDYLILNFILAVFPS